MKITRRPQMLLALLAALALLASAQSQTVPSPSARPEARKEQRAESLPPGVKAHRDLAYTKAGHARQKLDLFVPEKGTGPFPLVVWIHGGGWASGDKNGCPPLRGGYVERGYAVASLDYRLSGDALFPAAVEDCKAALRWLRAHAKQYHLDADHVGVWGSSAGGHLAAFLGTSGDTKEFDVGEHLEFSSGVQAASDYFGPTDFIQMDAHAFPGTRLIHDSPTSPESRFIGGPIQDQANRAKVRRADPITYVTKNDPPFLIVHGDSDPAVPHHQSELLYAALVKAGVPVRFITVKGGGHGQGFPGAELNPIVADFFDRHLKGNTAVADWPVAMTSTVKAAPAGAAGAPSSPSSAGAGRGPGISWEQVLRSDANQDGKISKEEFRGPPPLFARLDKNGDGFLTKEEHDAAAAPVPATPPAPAERTPKAEPPPPSSALPAPSQANVSYGPHERNVLDLWLAKSERPTPVAVFIHGGGFIGGSKEQLSARDLQQLLDAGISVAALNYRLLAQAPLPAAHQDVTRAVQFLRSQAAGWKLDKTRFGGFGGSAGAQLVMYLAFHDDLADPKNADPVARESSRLACVAPSGGQITMDMKWWDQHVPGYAAQAARRRTNAELFGTGDAAAAMKINAGISAIALIGPGDPPVFMTYSMAPGADAPADRRESQNWMIHHIVHGIELKKLCDQFGVEAHLKHPGAEPRYQSAVEFLKAKLLAVAAAEPKAEGAAVISAVGLQWTAAAVPSPDGKQTALLWAAPAGEGPFPVAMFAHGAPGGIGEQGLRGIAGSSRWRELVKRGFLVCLTDYRGHPDGKPFAVLDGEVNATDDLAAVVKHLGTLPQCDVQRLAVIGASLGGMTALEAAATGRLAPACLVLNAPATFPLLRLRKRPEAGRELTDADFDKAGALARVRKVSCPVLIVQGTTDGLAPLNKQLHAMLKEAGKDSRLELFEGQGHSFANGPENDAFRRALQLTADFVAQHTKPAAAPAVQPQPRSKAPPAKAPAAPAAWAEPKAEPNGMKYRTFTSKAAGAEVSYLIYLPPDYETAKEKRYPVVYWLHGRGGSQTGASQLVQRLDPAIRAGKAQPMIVVGINGLRTSSFVDSADGKAPVQTVIVKELIPHVDATYRTVASREGRAIEGFSMGGAGAPKIGFKYPELFGTVSILAGALHDLESYKSRGTAFQDIYGGRDEYFEANSPWQLVEQNADAIRGRTVVRVAVGAKDNLLDKNTAYHELLTKLKIEHGFEVVPNAVHNPAQVYDGLGDRTWEFYTRAFTKRSSSGKSNEP